MSASKVTVSNEGQLIAKALKGDEGAFRAIVEHYQAMVFTLSLKVVKDRMVAEDVSQEVFVKVYRKLETFAAMSSLKTWIYRITYRTALDAIRSRKAIATSIGNEAEDLDFADEVPNQLDHMEEEQEKDRIHRAIDQLLPDQALIVTLYYLEEKKIKEICSATGFTASKVKVDLHRGRNRLKGILQKI